MAEGSIPVGPGSMTTSQGAVFPTLAGVSTLLASMMGLNSNTGSFEKMNPTFPTT
jgi:ABC-type cobalamin transport system ATPase subunit